MNKNIFSLLCLTLIATTVPSCRNRKKEAPVQQEENNTMIDLDALIEEYEKEEELDRKVSKF